MAKQIKKTLIALDAAIYNVNFDDINKRFDPNQQVVYECLLNAGFGKIAIAGIMGNIHAESSF